MLLVTPGWMFAWAFLQRRRGFPVGWDVTRYPQRSPSCFQWMFPQMPRPALAARGLCFGALQTLVPLVVVFPLGFCRGVGLLACRVKPSGDILVFTLLSWGCPELVRAPRYCHTRIYNNESCVSTWRLCKTCTRFQEEVTESFPWEGIGRFLQRLKQKLPFLPSWGEGLPRVRRLWSEPRCPLEPPQLPLVIPACPCSPGGSAEPRGSKPSSAPAPALGKRFRASRGRSQPGLTLGCHWVLLPFCFILFTI